MLKYKLLSWQGTYPRPTGKGIIVLNGINLIAIDVPDKPGKDYNTVTKETKLHHWNPLIMATNRLLNHLKKKHHADFKFMNVSDLTIGDEI